jgi:hypothetical protein
MTGRTRRTNAPSTHHAIGNPAMRAGSRVELLPTERTVERPPNPPYNETCRCEGRHPRERGLRLAR